MKFDFAIVADGIIVFQGNNMTFVSLVAVLIGFPRKKYESVSFTCSTSDDEN